MAELCLISPEGAAERRASEGDKGERVIAALRGAGARLCHRSCGRCFRCVCEVAERTTAVSRRQLAFGQGSMEEGQVF
jgi:hypothetical protein